MRIRIKFFSYFKDIVGAEEIEIDVRDRCTVEELLNVIAERWPEMFEEDQVIILKNGMPAKFTDTIDENDEIAILPPVSGG